MVGAPDGVQPWMPRAARDKRGVPLAREHRGWREAPRMCRSRCAGILQRAPRRGATSIRRVLDALLARIGLDRAPAPDADGLRTLHRAYLERVPYEDLAVQLGETGPLDEAALAQRVLQDGRGGYCFELNTLFAALLRGVGFTVTHHQAVVGGDGPANHMALVVDLDGERWLADAGLGEGFLEPLPLREGSYERGPFTYTLSREPGGTWWMGQHEWSTFSGFRMQP